MKKPSRLLVIMQGVGAVIWIIKVVLDVVNQTNYVTGAWFVINVLCAVLWIVCFVVNLKRYLDNEEEQ